MSHRLTRNVRSRFLTLDEVVCDVRESKRACQLGVVAWNRSAIYEANCMNGGLVWGLRLCGKREAADERGDGG